MKGWKNGFRRESSEMKGWRMNWGNNRIRLGTNFRSHLGTATKAAGQMEKLLAQRLAVDLLLAQRLALELFLAQRLAPDLLLAQRLALDLLLAQRLPLAQRLVLTLVMPKALTMALLTQHQ